MGHPATEPAATATGTAPKRKGRSGRPKKENPRTHQCNVSLTAEEARVVAHRARMRNQTEVEFARSAMLAGSPYAMQEPTLPLRTPEERQLDDELRKMGVNLNQLVRQVNTHPDLPMPEDLPTLLAAIRRHLKAVLPYGA